MDANVCKTRVKEVKKAFAMIGFRIKLFGPEDITLEDKNDYKDYLEETRKLLEEAQVAAFKLCTELDISSVYEYERIQEIYQLESNATRDCTNKAREIESKIVELIASVPGTAEGTRSANNTDNLSLQFIHDRWIQREAEKEARLAKEKTTKIELRMKHVTGSPTSLRVRFVTF